jgi:hypothetical protein
LTLLKLVNVKFEIQCLSHDCYVFTQSCNDSIDENSSVKNHNHLQKKSKAWQAAFRVCGAFIHEQHAFLDARLEMPWPPGQLFKLPYLLLKLQLQLTLSSPGISCTADCKKESVRSQ